MRTQIPDRVLVALAVVSIGGAIAIGLYGSLVYTPVAARRSSSSAPSSSCAYNLELFGGRFHSDTWFAVAWGSFPLLSGYLAVAERITVEALLAALFAAFLSLAQRHLSTQVRTMRRRVRAVDGTIELLDGSEQPVTAETLTAAPEAALRALTVAVVSLAVALLVRHAG